MKRITAFIEPHIALSQSVRNAWSIHRVFRSATRAVEWLTKESDKAQKCIGRYDAYFVIKGEAVDLGPTEETVRLLRKAQR